MTIKPKEYPGSEDSFYSAASDICRSCLANRDAFAALKPKYTEAFIQDIDTSAVAASQLPNVHQRQGVSVAIRIALAAANSVCCNNFMTLMYYISNAFPAELLEARKKEAGSEIYKNAFRKKWRATATLNTMMLSFINTYSDELTAAGLPEDFPDTCTAGAGSFMEAFTNFKNYRTGAKGQSSEKVAANNAVYARLMEVMTDGKFIFKNNPLVREQFNYSAVLRSTQKPGKTGFRIHVLNKAVNEPIARAHISFSNSTVTGITDEKGVVLLEMPEGKFNFIISAAGFTTLVGVIATKKATMRHQKIEMTAGSGEATLLPVEIKKKTKKAAL